MNKKYSHQQQGVSITEHSQPKGIKPKMRERKLRSGVNRQGALEQESLIQGLHVLQRVVSILNHWLL